MQIQDNIIDRLLIYNYFYNPKDVEIFLNKIELSTNTLKVNNLKSNKDFWNYLTSIFCKDYILNILEISESTYYKIGYFYNNRFMARLSDRTIKRVNNLRLILRDSIT